MASKSSSVRSIRLQNDLWAWLTEEAGRRGVTVNGLVSGLVEVARLKVAERAAPEPALKPAKAKAAKVPKAVAPARKPRGFDTNGDPIY